MDGRLVTLDNGMIELMAKRRSVHISLEKQVSVQISTFRDYFGQNHLIGYRCPCQVAPYAMTYEGGVVILRNIIIKGTDPILASFVD
jgi:hypothetical protein